MTLSNQLTLSRILLTVVFLFLVFAEGLFFKCAALAVFFLASFTDYWDGRIARERGQTTPFGKLMDPIADKILAFSAFMAFVQMGLIPAWMVLIILARDLLITGVRFFMPGGEARSARKSGKHKTALQFAAIVGILAFLIVRETPGWDPGWGAASGRAIYAAMLFIVAVTLWSGVRFLLLNKDVLAGRP